MIMSGMRVGVTLGVSVALRMSVAATGIGAAFGIERRLDLDDAGTQPLHHRLDDMVTPDPQALGHDLRRQMTVAEMPGDANQMVRIGAADFDQRLGCGDHLDQPAVFEHQRVATAQRNRVFQIEQKLQPTGAGHRHPPPVTIVEIEHDGIGWRRCPGMLPANSGGADHANMLIAFRPCRR
jgi:hypothetical protein